MARRHCERFTARIWHYTDGTFNAGPTPGMSGNHSKLHGDCTGVRGDCTDLRGEITGIRGDVTGVKGDCSLSWGDVTGMTRHLSRTPLRSIPKGI